MWTNLERELDGMVGRMLSWLTQPPTQSSPLDDFEEHVGEAMVEDDLELDDAATEDYAAPDRGAGEPDGLEKKLLIALAAAPKGASMKQLQQATGGKAYAARQRLNRLIQAGRVERKGKGMRTHYLLAGS